MESLRLSANRPQSTRDNPLVSALVVLTFSTGLIDAVSYIGLGRVFVANMTGNVVLLGFAAAGIPALSVVRSLLSLLGFLLGAAAGGRLQTVLASDHRRKWLLSVGVVETALILAATLVSFGFMFIAALSAWLALQITALGRRSKGLDSTGWF